METLGVIGRLSSETQLYHSDADGELEQLLAGPSAQSYRSWLLRQYGFLAPLEVALDATAHLADVVDLRPRRKVPRLRADLLALGMSQPAISAAIVCTDVPPLFTRIPIALGWLYAVERSILQYGDAFRRLARTLPGEAAFASSYLKCYEGNIGQMWRAFGLALQAACSRAEDVGELVLGAQDAFRCLRRWQHRAGMQSAWPQPRADQLATRRRDS